MFTRCHWCLVLVIFLLSTLSGAAQTGDFQIGAARIDITPDYPIRLTGYAVRKTESEGVEQRLWAKALAISRDSDPPAILITVDNCGVCANVIDELANRLKARVGLPRERLMVCSSHTHSGPCTIGFAPNIFAMPIPAEQQATIARYTRELTDKLEQVALASLADRQPARLAWNQGKVTFAKNRRTADGPTDLALPILVATGLDGTLRAVVANYACHCTTIGGEFNKTCGDWVGYAQEAIEKSHPGAVALVTIGCGADSNPHPRGGADGGLALAKQHGEELAAEVDRMLHGALTPIRQGLSCRVKKIDLPFDNLPTREQWVERSKQDGIVGYHAKRNLERLDHGDTLPTTLPYFVQTWNFADQLAMVFLAGEVVVDYSLRLKNEFDRDRLWVTAYANNVPCYIPSRRILREGGYEAETSLWYYDRPARLAPAIEDLIDTTVAELMPPGFRVDPKKAEFPPPKSIDEALAAFETRPGFKIELVAGEPLIVDPVAIDWGPDGRLWVVEMRDYPSGMDGQWKPGGRVKFLEDTDGDGHYDKATVFLDNLPFPTGVMAWNKGVLVCAAPDILYAEDTNGDGHADRIERLFTGFATNNYQARVNGLSLGLDNWIYGANGLIGGKIKSGRSLSSAAATRNDGELNISGRDFRFHPDSGEFEPASGLTQQGRVRDDWGNWFGCDNSTLLWHYPMPDHYARRNPYVAARSPRISIATGTDPNQLFPASRTLERFNDPQSANRTTSACGLGIYRDDLLGAAYSGNAFVCEPVHNLVHRLVLTPDGVSFRGERAPDEQGIEFLASRDNWFRPVQVRTGPDGALYVVDMYRFVIEHPRWIPPERLAQLNARAGDDKGRIYRVVPIGGKARPIRDLRKMSTSTLAAALDSPNGTERDRVHLELLRRKDQSAVAPLIQLLRQSNAAAIRLQALCVLEGLNALTPDIIQSALADSQAAVRSQAVRMSEPFLSSGANIASANVQALDAAVLKMVADPDETVRYQVALSFGDWNNPRAGAVLGQLAETAASDSWIQAAVLSSATRFPVDILRTILQDRSTAASQSGFIDALVATAVHSGSQKNLSDLLSLIAPKDPGLVVAWQWVALSSFIDALNHDGTSLSSLAASTSPEVKDAVERIEKSFVTAYSVVKSATIDDAQREAAIRFVGRSSRPQDALPWLGSWLSPEIPLSLQTAAVEAMGRTSSPEAPDHLLKNWQRLSPAARDRIVLLLLTRQQWTENLILAMENGVIHANELTLPNRQNLLQSANENVRNRVAALLNADHSSSRKEVLSKYRGVETLTGDSRRGATVFESNCATCHALRGRGHAVGPDLSAFRDKPVGDFLLAILDPSATIEPRFINYQIQTRDGRSLGGVVKAEAANSLVVVQGGGIEETLLRRDIVAMSASNLSLMPEGLEQNIRPQEMADLIAWLKQPDDPSAR